MKKNSVNIMYISRIIGTEDAFTVSGLNCDPGIFRRNNLNLILDPFGGVILCFKELHNESLGLKAVKPGYH